jgi:hypothetical protein
MQYPKIIVALCFAACVSGALAQTKEKTAQYNALGASAARVVRDKGLDDPDSFRVTAAWLVPAVSTKIGPPNEGSPLFWVCFTGRAKNDMGGYVKIIAEAEGILIKDTTIEFVGAAVWGTDDSKYIMESCTAGLSERGGHVFADVTDAAKAALKADLDRK